MEDQENRIRELIILARDLELEAEGLRVQARRLIVQQLDKVLSNSEQVP